MKNRDSLAYQVDGVVVGVNSKKLFAKLGVVGKAPRGQVAMKFPAEEATSTIKDIIIQVGRTGKLTPVAILEPTIVAGSRVSRATLHNQDEISRKDIRIGDTVIIRKAGDVIPEVVEPITRMRTGKEEEFVMLNKCPICSGPVTRKRGEVDLYCRDKNCAVRQYRGMIHSASKAAFNIEGLGPKIVRQLIDSGLVRDMSDIFKLQKEEILPLERFADQSALNLFESIKKSRHISLDRFIYALGIRHVGDQTAINLAKHFRSLGEFVKANKEELDSVYGIGEEVAKSVLDYLTSKDNQALIKRLLQNGVKVGEYKTQAIRNKLSGASFVVTGSLESMTRQEAHKRIVQSGGKVVSQVTPKTDYLVLGENPGSKYDKAKKVNTKIISEQEFLRLIS